MLTDVLLNFGKLVGRTPEFRKAILSIKKTFFSRIIRIRLELQREMLRLVQLVSKRKERRSEIDLFVR